MPLNRIPNAADVPAGTIVTVRTPEQRRRVTYGAVLLVLAAAGLGTAAGYAIGRRRPKRGRR